MRPVGSKYLLEEPLGRGATGTVWRGRVRGDEGGAVAVKVLKEELAGDPDVVMRFLRERSALVRLRHPHIVRVRDLVVEGDLLALVMDLIDGPDLHRYLRENGPFSPVGASLLTAAVADALAASHADGIVHRDLKPANVILATVTGADGAEHMHPMLTDFGIARLADSPGVTRTHEFVGTPAYVAPESAQGRPQTSAVDVYGAGILLYELVTGRPPFRGDSAIEMLHAHLNEQPRRPSGVPEPLWTVIERCLRKEPDQRPSAESLARALRVVAAGITVHAAPDQIEAALGVAALLGPDTEPTPVPGMLDADPTQVLPTGSASPSYDPNAVTSMLPAGGDATRVLPPVPGAAPHGGGQDQGPYDAQGQGPYDPRGREPGQDQGRNQGQDQGRGQEQQGAPPQGPHPWESQLSAARHRNEQTEMRYLSPDQDPLRRRPRRQPPAPGPQQPPQQQPSRRPQPPQPPQSYGQPPQYGGQGGGQGQPSRQGGGYGQSQPRSRPAPQRYEPQRYEPRPPSAAPPGREPRAPREPRRSANPVKIPGLGCLKGCLTMVLVLVVVFVIVWYTTPLPDWVNSTRNLWDATSGWVDTAWDKISAITGDSGGGSGN